MKKLTISFILLTIITSCDQVKVTNSTDDEAVPVRVIQAQTPTEPNPHPEPNPTPEPTAKKITQYTVIRGNSFDEFITNVNTGIAQGWQPIGGICNWGGGSFAQAMGK